MKNFVTISHELKNLFFILCFPLLLFSFSGFNGESIIYVLKYIVNFLIKQKLYLFKKSP